VLLCRRVRCLMTQNVTMLASFTVPKVIRNILNA